MFGTHNYIVWVTLLTFYLTVAHLFVSSKKYSVTGLKKKILQKIFSIFNKQSFKNKNPIKAKVTFFNLFIAVAA